MKEQLAMLKEKGVSFLLGSYSALDRYFKIKEPGALYINTDATLVTLAKEFEDLSYPGFPFADAYLNHGNTCIFFRCVDNKSIPFPEPFTAMTLLYNTTSQVFLDPLNIYRDIRHPDLILNIDTIPPAITLIEAAKLVSRYHYETGNGERIRESLFSYNIPIEMQQHLLISILLSQYPWKGLSLLHSAGFIERYWPEVFRMCEVKHAKDYHPEGNVWEHTLETFKYRKQADLTLSLALLLHDIGKPVAKKTTENPFHEHSELGTWIARRFLARLGFSKEMQKNVAYLVRFHMIPWALKRLPLYRTETLMDSPLFPHLLELYRADVSATFRGPESYYDACRIYKNYLKNKKNSYRTMKGKVHGMKKWH